MSVDGPRPLAREACGLRRRAPVRIVHLGLGRFARSHVVRCTDLVDDAADWGVVGVGGRSDRTLAELDAQDDLYTLVTRAGDGDHFDRVAALSATAAAADLQGWRAVLAAPATAVVTLTVSEGGYALAPDGTLDLDAPAVRADLDALRRGEACTTTAGRLVDGLLARDRADAPPLAVVPCDNLSSNGARVSAAVRALADAADPALADVVGARAEFVSTVVDRITPATTPADVVLVADVTGWADPVPVVAEPWTEWVLCGAFPSGRPQWEDAGARFVDGIATWEQRKLRLLNGAHSLLAYVGPLRGHRSVAGAMADDSCRALVEAWWDEAAAGIDLAGDELAAYRGALAVRFANTRIDHRLALIAAGGSAKLPDRVVPTVRHAQRQARLAEGAVPVLAGWLCHLRGLGAPVDDPQADRLVAAAAGAWPAAARRVLGTLGTDLAADDGLVAAVADVAAAFAGTVRPVPREA